jgi:hypothetical protein
MVTHPFGDGDLDMVHRKVKASTVKEFLARSHKLTHTIASGEAQGTYGDRIKCRRCFGNPMGAVKRQATTNPDS